MKVFIIILRILGILFFLNRSSVAYWKIDFESEDPSLYSYMFYIWLMLIIIIIFEWIFSPSDKTKKPQPAKKSMNKEKQDLKKIQEEYEKEIVSKNP